MERRTKSDKKREFFFLCGLNWALLDLIFGLTRLPGWMDFQLRPSLPPFFFSTPDFQAHNVMPLLVLQQGFHKKKKASRAAHTDKEHVLAVAIGPTAPPASPLSVATQQQHGFPWAVLKALMDSSTPPLIHKEHNIASMFQAFQQAAIESARKSSLAIENDIAQLLAA
ncbi:hypothetical protein BC940DRAFT_365228 [Gongronella butleri]|nr:hypothetical protein BC940DRAFT_365228 [Gongronella butleri]